MVVADRDVEAEELAEGALRPAFVRQYPTLDHDLDTRGHAQVNGVAGIHVDRPFGNLRGHIEFADVGRRRRAGCEKDLRRCTDQKCGLEGLVSRLGPCLVFRKIMARTKPDPQFVVADDHRAVKGQVGHTRIRVFGQKHRRGDVGSRVLAVIRDHRQIAQAAVAAIARYRHVLQQRPGRFRSFHELVPVPAKTIVRRTDEAAQSRMAAIEVRSNTRVRALDTLEQQRTFAGLLGAFRDCGQLMFRIHLTADNSKITAFQQLLYKVPNDASPMNSSAD